MMKVVVVGLGSIGRRRAEVLRSLGARVVTVDPSGEADHATMDSVTDDLDAALICTPPDSGRLDQITSLPDGLPVFVEKPLTMDPIELDDIDMLARTDPDWVTMGACNMRFAYPYSRWRLAGTLRPWSQVRFVMHQHAKFWSPNHKPISLILDSIHELDLAFWIRGRATGWSGSSLRDECKVWLSHENGSYSIIDLDRRGNPPERYIEFESVDSGYRLAVQPVVEGMYEREMRHFLDCASSGAQTINPLTKAADVCNFALDIAL